MKGKHVFLPVVLATAALGVGQAQAKDSSFKFFGKGTSSGFTNALGVPLSGGASPAVGDELVNTDNLYPGTAKKHAKAYTGTAALVCVVTSAQPQGVTTNCVGVISFGANMILSQSEQIFTQNSGPSNFPITGGTGIYLHAKGSVKTTGVGNTNNSNFTVKIT